MKFCGKCNKHFDEYVKFCPICSANLSNNSNKQVKNNTQNNIFAILGLVFAFFIPLLGLAFSIVGLVQSKNLGGSGKGLAIGGIVVSLILPILIISLIFGLASHAAAAASLPFYNI
ncbi:MULTISPECIES: hypothetical protein [unclassified Mycoplasma]